MSAVGVWGRMKASSICAAACGALLLSALAGTAVAGPLDSPRFGAWGFDATGQDLSVRPGDDFFAYANGAWVRKTEIPADRSNYGNFFALRELSDARVRDLIEHAAPTGGSHDERLIGAYYRSFMDEARIAELGARPLEPELAAVRAARTRSDVARLMGQAFSSLTSTAFPMYVEADAKDPARWALWAVQGGLGLPDREYYLDAQFAEQRR